MAAENHNDSSTDEFVKQLTRHRHALFAFILKQVVNATDAEDIFQQTTVVLWRKKDQFYENASFFHWACGIAYNEVRNHRRTQGRSRLYFDDDLVALIAQESQEEQTLSEARRVALNACLASLQERQQKLIQRCYIGNDSISEVAAALGQRREIVYKQLARLKKKLMSCVRSRLAAEGVKP